MRKFLIFVSVFIILLVLFTIFLSLPDKKREEDDKKHISFDYTYQFVVNVPLENDPYWKELFNGVKEVADANNIALQYEGPEYYSDIDRELNFLEASINSRVDGIITHGFDDARLYKIIDDAVKLNIPVITVDTDASGSKRLTFVGSDNEQVGRTAADKFFKNPSGDLNVAVVTNNFEPPDKNMKVKGFIDALEARPSLKSRQVLVTNVSVLEAMDKVQEILKTNRDINAFYCTDPINTVGAARAVIDLNMVKRVKIVGHGDIPEIVHYIKQGVIYASLVQEPGKMGRIAVENLLKYKQGKEVPDKINTDISFITKDNVNFFPG